MPHKDPEARKEANRLRMQRRRAEGAAWVDPEKERERKAVWYAEKGGKEKTRRAERVRRGSLVADKVISVLRVRDKMPDGRNKRKAS